MLISFLLILSTSACTPGVSQTGEGGWVSPTPMQTPPASPTVELSPTPMVTRSPTVAPYPTDTPPPPSAAPPTEGPQASPTPHHCWNRGGYLEKESISAAELEHPLAFQVYLPPCYYHHTEQYYPVLYLLHGLYSTDNQWVRLGVVETARTLMTEGEIPPFIIVMPRDRDWSLPPENKFGDVLVFELVLWVDNHYRTIPGHEFRAIGGLSRGGNWALHIGLQYWGMFGALGAHSAPVFYTDGLKISRWLDEIPPEKMPRIFIDIGENDGDGEYIHIFEDMLNERGIPHEWHLNPGTHNEEYWGAHLEQYLLWYSETWGES